MIPSAAGSDRAAGKGGGGRRERPEDRVDGKSPSDDARRARQDLGRGKAEQPRGFRADPLGRLHAPGGADIRHLVVDDDRGKGRPAKPGAPDHDRCARERVPCEEGRKVGRRPVERYQRQGHPRGLGRLGRHEVEFRRPDAEAGWKRGLLREPRAMRGAVRKGRVCAGHGIRTVGAGPRSEAEIFWSSLQNVVELAGATIVSIRPVASTHVHTPSFAPCPMFTRVASALR